MDDHANDINKLLVFSKDPMKYNNILLGLIDKVNDDIGKVKDQLKNRREAVGASAGETNTMIRYKNQLEVISRNRAILQEMEEVKC